MSSQHNNHYRPFLNNFPENKAAELLRYAKTKPDVISIAQGEGDMPTPDFIINAAFEAAKNGETFYSPSLGIDPLRAAISTYYKKIYQTDVPTDRIFVTASATHAMHLALTSIIEPGDDVMAITPIWKNLLSAVAVAQGNITEFPLEYKNNQWNLDIDSLFASVTEKTKALLLVSPSNPTGWIMSDDEIRQIVAFARKQDIWIVADEVYGRMIYDKDHAPTFLHHIKDDDKVFIVNSFSKAYAMTGWRLGWLVGPQHAQSKIQDLALYNNMNPTTFAQYGAIAALENGEEFLKSNLALWQKNRDTFLDICARNPNIECPDPQATFYAFFKINDEPDCVALTKRLIDDVGVSVSPGVSFGKDFKGWIRICYGLSEELMKEAFDRLEKGLKKDR